METDRVAEDERIVQAFESQSAKLQSLLGYRVRDILLVASLYDSFTLSEGEHLSELISGDYYNLSLSTVPTITRVSTRRQALSLLRERPFDMVITMAQVGDMTAAEFGTAAKEIRRGLPVYLLAYSALELQAEEGGPVAIPGIDRSFVWRGDVRLFLTIIKLHEDLVNAPHDTQNGGVRVIVLVEDSASFYSSYLPALLSELVRQTSSLIEEEVNVGQRMLRRRLRPKILLATSYEEGWSLVTQYRGNVLCVISDVQFPRRGIDDPEAGVRLLRRIRRADPDVPLLLQSSSSEAASKAAALGAGFLRKGSPTILNEFRTFMLENLGFGDFVFRMPDGREVGRAADVGAMIQRLADVPVEALEYHGLRHDFSNWLMARTEFDMAAALRRLTVSDFASLEDMRAFLTGTLTQIQAGKRRGLVEEYNRATFDASADFVRIGGGSLGGKGRGLAFMHELLAAARLDEEFDGVEVFVPKSAIVGTDVFDRFMRDNDLYEVALTSRDDRELLGRFLAAPLPSATVADLEAYLRHVRTPIAVRSSSLLEDSQMLPAAGIYPTHMLGNDAGQLQARLAELSDAIRHIYAATFFQRARSYLSATAKLVEDEKMAVVVQEMVGRRHGRYVYPDLSGTADSHNYYPVREMRPEEGVATVALGLGKTVVAGERTVRFSPAHPQWLPQFSMPQDVLENAQREFRALDLERRLDFRDPDPDDENVVRLGLAVAEGHGTLWPVASVYSPENDAVHDGLSRPGVRLVTLAPVLKHRVFPLPELLSRLLRLGETGMSVPVEIEFAVDLQPEGGGPKRFALLQIRPLGARGGYAPARIGDVDPGEALISGTRVLGGGRIAGIRDVVAVRRDTFDRARTAEIAAELEATNQGLRAADAPYLLIGPGRWGTADPWLGVPVTWAQISGARVIVECPLGEVAVEPSQGTHFFHNVTSLGVGYFTIHDDDGHVDWAWLEGMGPHALTPHLAHYRLSEPLEVLIDGRSGEGVVLKSPREP